MAFQNSKRLVLDGRSILSDPRPHPKQNAIVDGIHLRIGVGSESEFPKHGYYLFRRAVADPGERCLSQFFTRVPVGPVKGNVLDTPYGKFTASPLVMTDEFDPLGVAEISLANGVRFELPAGASMRRFKATIGFRSVALPPFRAQMNFSAFPAGDGPNPRIEQSAWFASFQTPGTRAPVTRVRAARSTVGLDCSRQLSITFPRPARKIEIDFLRAPNDPPITITSFDARNVGQQTIMSVGSENLRFASQGPLTRLLIDAPGTLALLLRMSFEMDAATDITFTGSFGSATITGVPGQIVPMELFGPNAMTAVQISGGPAVLIDFCYDTCLSQFLFRVPAGLVKGNVLETPYGTLTAAALTATDTFDPKGTAEISLADEVLFALRPGTTARRVTAKIGFRTETKVPVMVDFRRQSAGTGPNPRVEQGARFEVFATPGTLAPNTAIRGAGSTIGLDCGKQLVLTLPPQASNFRMNYTRRLQDPPMTIRWFDPVGKQGAEFVVATGAGGGVVVGANLVVARVTIDSPGEVLLHDIAFDVDAPPLEVILTALAGANQVATRTVRGARGEIVAADLTGEGITSIRIGRGPAVLVDLCYTLSADMGPAWTFVPSFPYPLTLPITHPSYPASVGAESLTARRTAAAQRVRYGTAAEALRQIALVAGVGTLRLTPGSALAKGTGTSWTPSMVGQFLYPSSIDTAFAVMTVLAPDRLVLSRPFTGTAVLQNVGYRLSTEDAFAQIHDQLGALLSEPAGMRQATMPPVIEQSTGVRRIVMQANPNPAKKDERIPKGQGTSWSTDIEGLLIQIGAFPYVYRIAKVDATAQQLTLQPPYTGELGTFVYRIFSRSPNNNLDEGPAIDLRPVDLLELAAFDPAYAQILGLYWIDSSAEKGSTYDYMLLADHAGRFNRNGTTALTWLNGSPDFSGTAVDGAQLSGIVHTGSGALAAPATLQAFALPTGHMRARPDRPDIGDADAALSIRDLAQWSSQPPVMLDVWRASLGVNSPPLTPPPDPQTQPQTYLRLDETLLPVKRTTPAGAPIPAGWPDPAEVHYLDAGNDGLDVGWYAYRVVAIDGWGRYSAWSPPIPWQSTDGKKQLHPYAVHIEDRTPPPPPTDVSVTVLEPDTIDDPMRVADAAYDTWRKNVGPATVGLRVRWRWAWSHELRAPDLQEFRFYAQPAPLNARFHRIVSVIGATGDPSRSIVKLAAADALENDAYKAATLQVGERGYAIEGSRGGTSLELRVKNGGPAGGTPPPPGADATIVLQYGHPLHRSVIEPRHWERWIAAVSKHAPTNATVKLDIDPMEDPEVVLYDDASNKLQGTNAQWDLSKFRLDDLPPAASLAGIRPGIDVIAVASEQTGAFALLGIASVAAAQKQIVPAGPVPASLATGAYRWAIGAVDRGLRGTGARWTAATKTLDLLPAKIGRVRPGVDRIYVRADPASTPANVQHFFDIDSVDAVQNKLILSGAVTQLADGKLYEWRVGTPVRIYEAFFPSAKGASDDPRIDTLWLKPSLAEPVVYGTIGVSASDKRTEVPEWRSDRTPARTGNEGVLASPATIFRVHRESPPMPADGAWDAERLMASKAGYDGKSYFSVRWPTPDATRAPYYKALIFRASSETLFLVDQEQVQKKKRTYPLTFKPENDPRPSHWAPGRKVKVATELFNAPVADYSKLSDDALSVLANFQDNEEAFAQITINPLSLAGGANPDRRGPDDPPSYTVRPSLSSWVDTIPGRTRARYLYKIAFVDSAQNRGPMSKASPPVDVPKVVPPRTPVIMKIVGGNRKITLHWAANRERDLAGYRVYRTDDADKARDVRLMAKAGDAGPTDVKHTDSVPGLVTLYYRITAVDTSGNESSASRVASGRAFDDSTPDPPVWLPPQSGTAPGELKLTWSATDPGLRCMVQRAEEEPLVWVGRSGWLEKGVYEFTDRARAAATVYFYRLLVIDDRRRQNKTFQTIKT